MLPLPPASQKQFEEHLAKRLIPNALPGFYKKWFRSLKGAESPLDF
jgi:hypothetical protein